MIIVAMKLNEIAEKHPNIDFTIERDDKSEFTSYASHIGLFKFMKFDVGRNTGSAAGSQNYIPITSFDIADLKIRAGERPIGEVVNSEADRLARVLTQTDRGDCFDLLQISLREIVRNSTEHSNGKNITLFAQHWPNEQKSEIVVVDDGIGIFEALSQNDILDDCDTSLKAIKYALLPGVTGVPRAVRAQQDEFWGNSGFGLWMTSRLCARHGNFAILSDESLLMLGPRRQNDFEFPFRGTAAQLSLNNSKMDNLEREVRALKEEGENHQHNLLRNQPIKASMASTMLSTEFRRG